MQTNTPPTQSHPIILDSLPDPPIGDKPCPRRTRFQIDLILLSLEALDLGGSQAMLAASKDLDLQAVVKNRVFFWRLRCTNPFRRSYTRRELTIAEAKALVAIACHLARRQTVLIRQLLLAYEQLQQKELSPDHNFRLGNYLERFRAHFRSRMNLRRSGMAIYGDNEKLNGLAIALLGDLLFCTGTYGMQRFWSSLFDGEAA